MEHKTFLVETKAEGDAGEFVALASVFNNVDLVGDRVMEGAFDKSLAKFRSAGDPIPVIFDHQHGDLMAHIGKADPNDVQATKVGLEVRGQLDMENPMARQAFKLMKDRTLKAWSFAYTVPEGGQKRAKDANEITEIDLIEVGPTLKGANPEAQLQGIKSLIAEVKAEQETSPEAEENAPATAEVEDRSLRTGDGKGERQDPPRKTSDWTETEQWFLEVFGR